MQLIYSYGMPALFVVAGVLLVIFRRQVASHIIEKNRALFDSVPKLFPPPEADRDRLQLQVLQCLVAVVGLGFIGVIVAQVVESMR